MKKKFENGINYLNKTVRRGYLRKDEENLVIAPIIIETILDKEVTFEDTSKPATDESSLDKASPDSENVVEENVTTKADEEPEPISDIVVSEPPKENSPIFDTIRTSSIKKQSSEKEVKPKKSFFERLFRNDDDDERDF